jgi:23S rRNA (cytosine1962-C5)-methyltransferase
MALPSLTLPEKLEHSLAAGHPWVYRDHVRRTFDADTGTWVRLRAGRWTGYALWDRNSPIALRVFSERGVPDAAWTEECVLRAWRLREPLRIAGVTAYRWLNGEGDGLPGVVVDLYDRFAVLLTYADAVEPLVEWIAAAVERAGNLSGVVRRRAAGSLETLRGRAPPRDLVVDEYGVSLRVDVEAGQKTGLFLDHRENRRFVRELAPGRSVLNLFSYTGAFSVNAWLGGAQSVTSVDAAAPALDAAGENHRLNGLDPADNELVVGDVFETVERFAAEGRRFDLVIADPPSFARGKDQRAQAERAYVRLHDRALRLVERGGFYAAASCTAQISPDMFRESIAQGAARARCRFQTIHDAGQPLDHPVMAGHTEGRYLKFVVGRVLPVV